MGLAPHSTGIIYEASKAFEFSNPLGAHSLPALLTSPMGSAIFSPWWPHPRPTPQPHPCSRTPLMPAPRSRSRPPARNVSGGG